VEFPFWSRWNIAVLAFICHPCLAWVQRVSKSSVKGPPTRHPVHPRKQINRGWEFIFVVVRLVGVWKRDAKTAPLQVVRRVRRWSWRSTALLSSVGAEVSKAASKGPLIRHPLHPHLQILRINRHFRTEVNSEFRYLINLKLIACVTNLVTMGICTTMFSWQ
jgi:hypothetical protein